MTMPKVRRFFQTGYKAASGSPPAAKPCRGAPTSASGTYLKELLAFLNRIEIALDGTGGLGRFLDLFAITTESLNNLRVIRRGSDM